MADETTGPVKAKKGKMGLIIGAVVALAAGGAGAFFFLGKGKSAASEDSEEEHGDESAEEEHGDEEEGDGKKHKKRRKGGFGVLVPLEPIVANLNEPEASRYVKVTPQLEVANEATKLEVEKALIPIRSRLLLFFSTLTVADLQGGEKKVELQETLLKLANEVLGDDVIEQVYFSELVVQ